jgi:MFS family permease
VSALVAKPIGRVVDRRGAGPPLVFGLSMTALLLATLALPRSVAVLAVLGVFTMGGPLTAYTIPAMSVITDSAERAGVALAFSSMLLNMAWALGEMIGAPTAASISQATSDAVPFTLLAALMAVTLIPVVKARFVPLASHASAPENEVLREPASQGRVHVGTP